MDEAHYHTWTAKANGRETKSMFQNAAVWCDINEKAARTVSGRLF